MRFRAWSDLYKVTQIERKGDKLRANPGSLLTIAVTLVPHLHQMLLVTQYWVFKPTVSYSFPKPQ